ncbi:MAG: 50S ribosomal protein L9 [Zoogloeaceae bacterium]|nr:50S ribosomal protein L9 [Rhodocyclaceae bacterium]MCP5237488.1 50S ribosomal protein L9 [Zoogloeaceae bacterium]
MQIILLEKLANLGSLGDVIKVRDGYARNYLIPQGKAKRATAANLAEFEERRAELEKIQADRLAAAQSVAEKLDGLALELPRKAGVDGRLFGSVGGADIIAALGEKGIEIERGSVRMPDGPIKQTGENALEVALHSDVVVTINVAVVAEQ